VDAGTMNPTEHGEVFVMDSGLETDQDMGNYERFLDITLPPENYLTTGSVYQAVINRERNLEYKGKCVQIIPHVTNEVINKIKQAGEKTGADVVIIEIGGTTGDYENQLFTEAARQMNLQHSGDVLFVMLSFIPYPKKIGEMKTKPTQQAVRLLNAAGVQPDIIIARSERKIDDKRKEKIALFCNVDSEAVISAPDVESIYDVPLNFEKDGFGKVILNKLSLKSIAQTDFNGWGEFVKKVHSAKKEIRLGVIGKYFNTGDCVLSDSYISVIESIKHASYNNDVIPKIDWIDAETFEKDKNNTEILKQYDGIIVPGGFGSRGVEGIITTIKFARENKIPYLGLCYGMQLMVIEFARNIVGLKNAHTTEIKPRAKYKIIDLMEKQKANLKKGIYGATMRLGAYPCILKNNTLAKKAYGKKEISERHRHRYEVNNKYIKQLEKAGLIFSGTSPNKQLMEIAELPKTEHPFMVGSQFHPEFTSSPLNPNPLFNEFVKSINKLKK
jgi:CTP synthase